MSWLLSSAKIVLVVYICMLVAMYIFQRSLLYFPASDLKAPEYYGLSMQEVEIKTADNIRLSCWYQEASKAGYPTIIYYHGNGGHLGLRNDIFNELMKAGFGVLGVSYRGYGNSEGTPSEAGFYEDGRAAIKFIKEKGIKEKDILLFGESLGTGVATKMAEEFDIGWLVLQAPFTSVTKRASEIYPFFPISLLAKDKYESINRIKNIKAPLLILHGEQDGIIPLHHGKELFAAAHEPKKIIYYPKVGHEDFPTYNIVQQIKGFVK